MIVVCMNSYGFGVAIYFLPTVLSPPDHTNSQGGDTHTISFKSEAVNSAGKTKTALAGITVKNTYGTGCFLLMNIGNEFKLSKEAF